MTNLLDRTMVTLSELSIIYDGDHREKRLAIVCDPHEVDGTGRKMTEEQMAGIGQVLFDDYEYFDDSLEDLDVNLLPHPVSCQLVFSEHTLVAIGLEKKDQYCHLETGDILSENALLALYKSRKEGRLRKEIMSLLNKVMLLENELNELSNIKF